VEEIEGYLVNPVWGIVKYEVRSAKCELIRFLAVETKVIRVIFRKRNRSLYLLLFKDPFKPRFALVGIVHDRFFTAFFHPFPNRFCLQAFVIGFDRFSFFFFKFSSFARLFPLRFANSSFILFGLFRRRLGFRLPLSD